MSSLSSLCKKCSGSKKNWIFCRVQLARSEVGGNPGRNIRGSTLSTRQLARTCDVSQSSVRILKKNKFHPYKIQLYQASLSEDDPDRRVEFCELMDNRIAMSPEFLRSICFSDEATFYLDGEINRHNCRYWDTENPHKMKVTPSFPKN